MIQYVKRSDLNVDKYNACIENSIQSRIYGFSWYLDIVADNWDVLVLDDYKAVMPIPWKKKYFIKYVTQPLFCQQLGIFTSKSLEKEDIISFFRKIPIRFVKVSLNLNSFNYFDDNITRKNYILDLNKNYQSLSANFSRTRRQRVRFGKKINLEVKRVAIDKLVEIQQKNYNYEGFSDIIISKLSKYIIKNEKGFVLGVYKENELLGGGFFIEQKQRIIYLFSSFNNSGRKYQAASFLINFVIEKNQQKDKILDFEGGNIKSIGDFFKSFGAHKENFYQYSKSFF